ncbi:hypothetical protein KCU66_g14, partial [Aureobasidium melanogenum]
MFTLPDSHSLADPLSQLSSANVNQALQGDSPDKFRQLDGLKARMDREEPLSTAVRSQDTTVLLRAIGCCIEAAAVAQRNEDEVVMLSIKPTTQHRRREVCLGTIDAKVTAHTRFTAVVGAGSGTDRGWPVIDIRLRDEVIPLSLPGVAKFEA